MIKWSYCVHPNRNYNATAGIKVEDTLAKREISQVSNKADGGFAKTVWTKKRKIAAGIISAGALALIVFVVMIFVFDLGPLQEIPRSEEEARVVGECAGYEVYYDELRYLTLLYRDELEAKYGAYDSLSDGVKAEYERELEEIVFSEIKNNYAVLALCEQYGIDTNSSEARKHVKESLEDLVDEIGSREDYKVWLAENNLTDAFLRFIYKVDYLEGELLEELTRSGEVVEFTPANLDNFVKFVMEEEIYAKVIHVYYPREHFLYSDRGTSMTVEVNAALEELTAAKTDKERYSVMKTLIGKAPFEQGYSVEGMGSYITYGQMHKDYERAAFSLGDYGISNVIELEEGCYIIMRLPKDRDEVARKAYELVEYYRYAVLKQLKDAKHDSIVFNGNEYLDGTELVNIK